MIGVDHLLLNALNYSIAEQNWMDFSWLSRRLFGKNAIDITIPKLSGRDVSEVIKCLSSVCKDALQRYMDEDFATLRLTVPHLQEAVEVHKTRIKDINFTFSTTKLPSSFSPPLPPPCCCCCCCCSSSSSSSSSSSASSSSSSSHHRYHNHYR